MRVLHEEHWSHIGQFPSPSDVPDIFYEETKYRGEPYLVPIVILRSNPCLWFIKGGCTMCNYMESAGGKDSIIGSDDLIRQVNSFLIMNPSLEKFPYIMLTSAGSFLSSYEVPFETTLEILRMLKDAGLKRLSFESEAKYCINRSKLKRMKEVFQGNISIGIGVESSNETVRNLILNKGLPWKKLEEASRAIYFEDLEYYNYLLIGKPFLSPSLEIMDSVESIKDCLSLGASMIVLRFTIVQPNTLIEHLYKKGLFKVPSLWLGIEVLSRLDSPMREKVSIKGFNDKEPSSIAVASSCPLCADRLRTAFCNWNYNGDFPALIEDAGTCSCRPQIDYMDIAKFSFEFAVGSILREFPSLQVPVSLERN